SKADKYLILLTFPWPGRFDPEGVGSSPIRLQRPFFSHLIRKKEAEMAVKYFTSALSTAGLAVMATLGVLLPCTAVASPTYVQGAAASTGSRVPSLTVTLAHPVAQGDLLVGWFAQYNAPGHVQVSDNVNGTWTRAVASLTFDDDTGDIALYYCENSQAAPRPVTTPHSARAT